MKRDWRIKDLTLQDVFGLSLMDELRWIEHCAHLKRLTWYFPFAQGNAVLEEILQSIAANTWPELEELYHPLKATDKQASFIISKMQRVLGLSIGYSQPFDLVKTALRPHFSWLKILDISNAPGDNTAFIIEILKSCPQLEIFQAGEVRDCDAMVDDAPWACECSLRDLKVQFRPKKVEQRGLIRRLSRFRNLERLDVSNWVYHLPGPDFRLESGLDQLATLTRLKELRLTRTDQAMTLKDLEWMIDHWKNIEAISGTLNSDDLESGRLWLRCNEAGISVS
jgi:hypothetical protein